MFSYSSSSHSEEDSYYSANSSLPDEVRSLRESFGSNHQSSPNEPPEPIFVTSVSERTSDELFRTGVTAISLRRSPSHNFNDSQPEVEFLIKNLDTGEQFSSKLIDEKIPKGLDPVSLEMLRRSRTKFSTENSPNSNHSPRHGSSCTKKTKKKPAPPITEKSNQIPSSPPNNKNFHNNNNNSFNNNSNNNNLNNNNNNLNNNNDHQNANNDEKKVATKRAWLVDQLLQKPSQILQKTKGLALYSKPKETVPQMKPKISHQTLYGHKGSIWTMKFNFDGTLMATGGSDRFIHIWKVQDTFSPKTGQFFEKEPIKSLVGHEKDVLELDWSSSRSNILLSISLDNTVCCWKVNEKGEAPFRVFPAADLPTSIRFHPKNEELFVFSSLDKTLELWNINEQRLVNSISTQSIITSLTFTNDPRFFLTGTYEGYCIFYELFEDKEIKYHSHLKKNHKISKGSKKISGVQMMPNCNSAIITSNDSCVRMYNLDDGNLVWKAKNIQTGDFQIYATPSETGKYILCGSRDLYMHVWELGKPNQKHKEDPILAYDSWLGHPTTVICTRFAPFQKRKTKLQEGQIIVSACTTGQIKIWEQKFK